MDYIELNCNINSKSEIASEILIAELNEVDFESFYKTKNCLKAYIQAKAFDFEMVKKMAINKNKEFGPIKYSVNLIKDQNWNTVWEKNFDPVIINNQCIIRAPFHKKWPKLKYEIIIAPKMSFGTGHHETTVLMMEEILQIDITDKNVADMGCGTGVLAILSSLKGAKTVTAIDNNEWAYHNTFENIKNNNIENISVFYGNTGLVFNKKFDLILANISRNILLKDMKKYAISLITQGKLIVSGFYKSDMGIIKNEAFKNNLKFQYFKEKNNWVALVFQKHN